MTPDIPATRYGFNPRHLVLALALLAALATFAFRLHPGQSPLEHAQMLIHEGKAAAALPVLEQFSKQHPDNSFVFPLLASAYLSCERLAEGRTALDTSLRLKLPADSLVPVILDYASYYQSRGDYDECWKLFNSAEEAVAAGSLSQGQAKLFSAWAEADLKALRQDDAVKHLDLALQYTGNLGQPFKTMIFHSLARTYRQLAAAAETKNDQKAIFLLQKSLSVADEPATRMALAAIYSRQGRLQDAIYCYSKVKDDDQNNLEARHRLVELLMAKKEFARAQEALLELTDKERSVENYQLLSAVDQKLSNTAGAVKALEDARKLRPKDLSLLVELETILTDWADLLARQKRLPESISARGHAARVSEMIASLDRKDKDETRSACGGNSSGLVSWPAHMPPIAFISSRIWLNAGSLTPEGEIAIKNISGQPISDLSLTMVFYDNTRHVSNGSIIVPVSGPSSPPFQPGARGSLYFSCPHTVVAEDQLAVIVFWHGRLLKELPVVKRR